MKNRILILLCALLSCGAIYLTTSRAADEATTFQSVEFATIRWDGRENSCLIRPNGKVEKLRSLFERMPRPQGVDDRTYYLSIAMNAFAREGFDIAGITPDEIVMKRSISR